MKRLFLYILLTAAAACLHAQSMLEAFNADINAAAANNHEYPFLDNKPPAETQAPEGYEPFYISHYGRHGSRWLLGYSSYDTPIKQLMCAERNGKLTPLGKRTLETMKGIRANAEGNSGALSKKGAHQHMAIARRMFCKYRSVFKDNAVVDARSTTVTRSIESMDYELAMLENLNPMLKFVRSESKDNMYYLNYRDSIAIEFRKPIRAELKRDMERKLDTRRFMAQLVNDEKFVADSLDGVALVNAMWAVASNQQSEYTDVSLYDLFRAEDIYPIWEYYNLVWYTGYGPYPPVKGRGMYSQVNLLNDFVQRADEAIAGNDVAANLRFGHDTVVMPLVCLMGINNFDEEIDDNERVADTWSYGRAIPMGANVQLIFYRNAAGDVLVKALLNEVEATLPATPVTGPYYKWNDVRNHFMKRITSCPVIF